MFIKTKILLCFFKEDRTNHFKIIGTKLDKSLNTVNLVNQNKIFQVYNIIFVNNDDYRVHDKHVDNFLEELMKNN